MRVAEGVIDPVHPAIRQEMVMHDDAPCKSLGMSPRFSPARQKVKGKLDVVCNQCNLPAISR
jgi:hypothetical protein